MDSSTSAGLYDHVSLQLSPDCADALYEKVPLPFPRHHRHLPSDIVSPKTPRKVTCDIKGLFVTPRATKNDTSEGWLYIKICLFH